jgi:cytochrome c-type biogenesis protein CcmH
VRGLALLAALTAALALPTAATAAACPQTTLGDVEDEVMCSICKTPLNVAEEAPQAQRERAYIARLIARCRSKDQIKRALVAQFGPAVLALPGDAGDDGGLEDKLVYIVPGVVLLLAATAIALTATRWRRTKRGNPTATATAAAAADSTRVDLDMERYDL